MDKEQLLYLTERVYGHQLTAAERKELMLPGYLLIDNQGKIIQTQIRSFAVYEQIRTFKEKNMVDDLEEILTILLNDQ